MLNAPFGINGLTNLIIQCNLESNSTLCSVPEGLESGNCQFWKLTGRETTRETFASQKYGGPIGGLLKPPVLNNNIKSRGLGEAVNSSSMLPRGTKLERHISADAEISGLAARLQLF